MLPPLASTRTEIGDFVQALVTVYTILIIGYILFQLVAQFGRIPYNRALSAVIEFLQDVCEPYLRIWRRLIPPIGPLDLSPMVGIIVLQIVGGLVAALIRG